MNQYVLGVDAELDLDAIWEYVAQDNVEAADRWIAKPTHCGCPNTVRPLI